MGRSALGSRLSVGVSGGTYLGRLDRVFSTASSIPLAVGGEGVFSFREESCMELQRVCGLGGLQLRSAPPDPSWQAAAEWSGNAQGGPSGRHRGRGPLHHSGALLGGRHRPPVSASRVQCFRAPTRTGPASDGFLVGRYHRPQVELRCGRRSGRSWRARIAQSAGAVRLPAPRAPLPLRIGGSGGVDLVAGRVGLNLARGSTTTASGGWMWPSRGAAAGAPPSTSASGGPPSRSGHLAVLTGYLGRKPLAG